MNRLTDIADVHQGLVLSGGGAGRHVGDWVLQIVESRNVRDGRLEFDGLGEISVIRNVRTERHLLRPFDVLVTARAGRPECALVPPDVSRTVAGVTLLVVRPRHPESGAGHYLWYFLNSTYGKAQLARRMVQTTTITSLSARSLGDVEIAIPSARQLDTLAKLAEAAETAYASELEVARLRREKLRDSILNELISINRKNR